MAPPDKRFNPTPRRWTKGMKMFKLKCLIVNLRLLKRHVHDDGLDWAEEMLGQVYESLKNDEI